jgi:hypothetical protein
MNCSSALVLCLSASLLACSGSGSTPRSSAADPINGASNGDAAAEAVVDGGYSSSGPSTVPGLGPDGSVANCSATSPDQEGCPCASTDVVRTCYPGAAETRNVGECKDGKQACTDRGGEFGLAYGPCVGHVLPTVCGIGLDGMCSGKIGCDDPNCRPALGCDDAGSDEPPPCTPVTGQNGNVTLPNGSMFCEGDFLGGLFGP